MTNASIADASVQYATIPINKLKHDPNNARKHGAKNLAVIKGSLERFGQTKPILVTRDNLVVAGNGTLKAARSLGWKEVKVVYTDLVGDDLKAYALVDNQAGILAEWDMEILGDHLQYLGEEGWNLADLGFGEEDEKKTGEDPPEDKTQKTAEYLVVVECSDEWQQKSIYEELRGRSLTCKLL